MSKLALFWQNRVREAIEDVKHTSLELREKLDANDDALEQLELELAIEENDIEPLFDDDDDSDDYGDD